MTFREYQQQAQLTDQVREPNANAIVVPLLGLAGEVGSLLGEYKKALRDGPAYRLFKEQVAEELGDILWYAANVASKFNLDLEEVARVNLAKTRDRWPTAEDIAVRKTHLHLLDDGYPQQEQLPRRFLVELSVSTAPDEYARVVLRIDGAQVGDRVRDNAYEDDGYRFHDVFHLAYAAVLGWSPVLRALLKRKRKSVPQVDEVEDGGRAIVIDEAIAAFVFDYARKHNFLEGVNSVDYGLLKTIRGLVSGLEVHVRTAHEWERAILTGYEVWRAVRKQGGGQIQVDLIEQTMALI